MPSTTRFLTSAALALAAFAPAAHADLTAAEVWNDWKGYFASMGYEVSGAESESGGVLTVSGVSLGMNFPEDDSRFEMAMDTLTFTENGDGTVAIAMPAKMPLTIAAKGETGEAWDVGLDFTQNGLVMKAAGSVGDIVYTYSADSIAMALSDVSVDGEPVPEGDAEGNFTLEGVTGSTSVKVGEMRDISQTGTASRLSYLLNLTGPDASKANVSGNAEAIDFSSALKLPLGDVDTNDPAAMMAAGFEIDSQATFGPNNSTFSGTGTDGAMNGTTASQGGNLSVRMATDGLAYDITQNGLAVALQADATPLPLAFELSQFALNLKLPVAEAEEAQDFALKTTLADLVISEAIWMMFDPQGQLPRDPATAMIDVTGKARITGDLLDPAMIEETDMGMDTPGEVDSVTLNALRLALLGAELTGSGAFDIDNSKSDLGPVPSGSINLKLTGGNGLLDKLVASGFIPQEQAMGARMMMGLFGAPTGEPDTLTSKIDFLDDGQILANGQRIK